MTTVVVRADASASSGSGHVVRQLTLAGHLAERGAEVVFASRRTRGDRIEQVEAAGHRVVGLPDLPEERARRRPWDVADQLDDARALLAVGLRPDVTIVDSYHLDATWEEAVRPVAGRLVAVDDLDDRIRDVDLVVDQNWYGPGTVDHYVASTPPSCRRLLGPWYALLQPAYAAARRDRDRVEVPPRRVVVAFGGADVTGETAKVLEALGDARLDGLVVDVVIGSPAAVTEQVESLVAARPGTTLHVAVPSLAPLFAAADLAVGASGTATWERLCLGTPAIVATTRPEQSGVTSRLAEAGLTTWVGLTADTTVATWGDALVDATRTPAPVPPDLVDGRGAERVAEAVLPAAAPEVTLRPATRLDRPLLLGTDLGTAGSARVLDGPAVWEAAALAQGGDDVLVVDLDGVPHGVLRPRRDGAARLDVTDVLRHRGDLDTLVLPAVREQAAAHGTADVAVAPARDRPPTDPRRSTP